MRILMIMLLLLVPLAVRGETTDFSDWYSLSATGECRPVDATPFIKDIKTLNDKFIESGIAVLPNRETTNENNSDLDKATLPRN